MSNPSTLTLQLAASVANGISHTQTPAGPVSLVLNGSLVHAGVATLDVVARRASVTSTGNDATVVFTFTGTDRNGNVQTDTVTGVNTTTGYTARDFLTVTSVTTSAGTAGAITTGTNGVGSSVWVVDDFLARVWALAGGINGPAGTVYTLEHTWDDPNAQAGGGLVGAAQFSMNPASNVPPLPWPKAGVVNVSGMNEFDYANHPIMAHRLTIVSGTGLVQMQSMQAAVGSGW